MNHLVRLLILFVLGLWPVAALAQAPATPGPQRTERIETAGSCFGTGTTTGVPNRASVA